MYKQRVKHLLYEHQDGLSRLKAAGEAALKQQARGGSAGRQECERCVGLMRKLTVASRPCCCSASADVLALIEAPISIAWCAAACCPQADAFAQQEAQLGDDKRRLKQHVREQELSAEELIKQFR